MISRDSVSRRFSNLKSKLWQTAHQQLRRRAVKRGTGSAAAHRSDRSLVLEPLEERRVLSTIFWANRGAAADGFDAAFGAGAPADAARAVIDAAIDHWERVITSFNYESGPANDTLTIDVVVGNNAGCGASANHDRDGNDAIEITEVDPQGKPRGGRINLRTGPYFVDPTPNDHSEFLGAIDNAFAGTPTPGGPADNTCDLYSLMALELTHILGISTTNFITQPAQELRLQTGGLVTDTGVAGNEAPGNLFTFIGPSVSALLTGNNGGNGGNDFNAAIHTAEPGNTFMLASGVVLAGSNDTGNAVCCESTGLRYLPSNLDALILKDAYDYDVTLPETFGTFYSVLNETTGVLTVRGGTNNAGDPQNDIITIVRNGDQIVVSVDVEDDVAGTGPTDAFVSVYPAGQIVSIVVNAGDGNDTVTASSDLGLPLTINGEGGNDTLIGGDVTMNGGAGNDYLTGSIGPDSLVGGDGNDTILGLEGNDTLVGGTGGDQLFGGPGANTITQGAGDGNDLVDLSENSVGITYTVVAGNDTIIGTAFDDVITGGGGNERLEGRAGQDVLDGRDGNDDLFGGADSDLITAGPGFDTVDGGTGDDSLNFADGNGVYRVQRFVSAVVSVIRDGGGSATVADIEELNVGPTIFDVNDYFVLDLTGTSVRSVNIATERGQGFVSFGSAANITLDGSTTDDNIDVGPGGIAFQAVMAWGLVQGNAPELNLTINGLAGNDNIKVSGLGTTPVTLDGGDGDDFLSADSTLIGGDGNDTLVGSTSDDLLDGGAGDDVIAGVGGTDSVIGGTGNDTILVQGTAGDDSFELRLEGVDLVASLGATTVRYSAIFNNSIERAAVEGQAGDDVLLVNSINGSLRFLDGIDYDGGVGDDQLNLSGGTAISNTYSVGTVPGSGNSTIVFSDGTQQVNFQGLEPVLDLVAGPLVVNATPEHNAISYTQGAVATNGRVTVDNYEYIEFTAKTSLTINALGGSDEISLNNPTTPTGLTSITVNGGDPTASDTLVVNGITGTSDNLRHNPTDVGAGNVVNDSASQPTVNFTGIEHLQLVVQLADGDDVRLEGTTGNDRIEFAHGAQPLTGIFRGTLDLNNATGVGPFALTETTYRYAGTSSNDIDVNFFNPGGSDSFLFNGTLFDDTIGIGPGEAGGLDIRNTIAGQVVSRLEIFNVTSVTARGGGGDDTFNVALNHSTTTLTLEGGEPSASDVANLTGSGGDLTLELSTITITQTGFGSVDLNGFEQVNVSAASAALIVNGTAADDLVSVAPAATGQGSFTADTSGALVQTSPLFVYDSVGTFTVNGGAGFDILEILGNEAVDTVTSGPFSITVTRTTPSTVNAGTDLERLDLLTFGGHDNVNLAAFTSLPTLIFGGGGNDTLVGTPQSDIIHGEDGDDTVNGGASSDRLLGGRGRDTLDGDAGTDDMLGDEDNDRFVWDPGDGSDVIEGGSGSADVMLFNGSAGPETFTFNAVGTRLEFLRSVGAIDMDVADVEQVDLLTVGGTDAVIVNDITQTDVRVINVNLGLDAALNSDTVTVRGRSTDDHVQITAAGGVVSVVGLAYDVNVSAASIVGGEADRLIFEGGSGNDVVKAENAEGTINITLDGGTGDDQLSADAILIGGAGNDFLEGGPGDDQFFGNAGDDTMIGLGGNDTYDGGSGFDSILIRGTAGPDRIDIDQPSATSVRHAFGVIGVDPTETDTITTVAGVPTVERVLVETYDSADILRVTPSEALIVAGTPELSINFTIDGGEGFDRLIVHDGGLGDTVIYRQGEDDRSGSITVGGLRAVVFGSVEQNSITPLDPITGGTGADGAGRLVVFQHDPYEENDALPNATFLGAGETINVDPNIDPGADALFGAPADEDFYRLVAETTGTLDIQVYFRQIGTLANGRAGLPGDGNLNIEVRDETGDLISGFGVNDATDDERVRIPAVAGQTYYLRVRGATADALNAYDITVINTPPPVPYDLELLDNPVGDPPPLNSDSGRSQFDNITRITTPTIVFRLDDAIFLNDLPGNNVPNSPPDEVIVIPFQAAAGAAGYRVAVFDEGSSPPPGTQVGTPPQTPLGFATFVSPGVYQFTTPALTNGSHFLTARVQMVDPANPTETGFGARSDSLEVIIDTLPPPVFFGSAADPTDGLIPDPGVTPQPPLFVDNKTNDRTPSFFGTAEADTVIRVFADLTPENGIDNFDVLLGLTVTLPYDGTNQFPNGQWRLSSTVDLNDPAFFPVDGLRRVLVTAEDVAGNVSIAPFEFLNIFLDTQGAQVTGVFITSTITDFDLVGLGTGNTLLRFNSAAPNTVIATTPITGLGAGDVVVGIDVRPANGRLYAVVDGGASDRIYDVNPFTGAATLVSTLSTALVGTSFGVDFNPVPDRLRIVSDADQNLRVNVDTGAAIVDGALNPGNPNVVAAAYNNNLSGATFTALYTIDSNTDTLNLQNPPNGGTQVTVGALGVNVTDISGFDIMPATMRALASLTVAGVTSLYNINLLTGAATVVGAIGTGATPVRGLTALAPFDLFNPKPSAGPTPLVQKLTISLQDLPPRVAQFLNPVVNPSVAVEPGHFTVIGDANGIMPITSVTFTAGPALVGQPATGTITLMFDKPLPDDRFTLILNDQLVDDAGNLLDGESNASQPLDNPTFPSGDGQPGGNFVARFTVDSRPEIGTWAGGTVWVDTNGNGYFDPENRDFVNRDIVYAMGLTTDDIFAGNFGPQVGPADGFDKLAAYGFVNGNFRWLVDIDNDGVADVQHIDPSGINGLPVAGNFDGDATNGDEVGVFDGTTWHLDTDRDYEVGDAGGSFTLATTLRGLPIVGDFNGDGRDDLGTWLDDTFYFDIAAGPGPLTWNGVADLNFRFGFIGVREQPLAADIDRDGFTDVGLWVPDREGQPPREGAEWYFLVSNGSPLASRVHVDPILSVNVIDFEPVPFGPDLFQQMGDEFALPVFGNFDPPVRDLSRETPMGNLHFNVKNPFDVNVDGKTDLNDLLYLVRDLHKNGSRQLTGSALSAPYLDVVPDGAFNPRDIAALLSHLSKTGLRGNGENSEVAEGESSSSSHDAVFAQLGHEPATKRKNATADFWQSEFRRIMEDLQ